MRQPGQSKAHSWEQGSGTVLSLALIAVALLLIVAPLKLKVQLTWPP